MGIDQVALFEWFASYAYEPLIVYSTIVFLLVASSFGLPIPEEVTLISAGLMAYIVMHPEMMDPPRPGAQPVSLYGLMLVTFLSVFLSDLLVFFIGRYGGRRLKNSRKFTNSIHSGAFLKAERWTKKYGAIMSGVFRFTPGLRFPGHMMCGMMGVPLWQFIAVDGTAALLTVPTQVWVVANYGDFILSYIKQFKIILLLIILTFVVVYLISKFSFVRKNA